jgi:hypothetical protein
MVAVSSRTLRPLSGLKFLGILSFAVQGICLAETAPDGAVQSEKLVRMKCGARIECTTPDGQASHVSKVPAQDPGATALIMEDDTVTCVLQAGETDFVIELPQTALLDRFTFLNENAVAQGELRIAVSNRRLRADSKEWTEVEGIVPFSHKRLFGVSLLGIEAKFVRLSFQVEKQGRIAALAGYGSKPGDPTTRTNIEGAPAAKTFQASALDNALNSRFAIRHSRESMLLTANSASVGPLSPSATAR